MVSEIRHSFKKATASTAYAHDLVFASGLGIGGSLILALHDTSHYYYIPNSSHGIFISSHMRLNHVDRKSVV